MSNFLAKLSVLGKLKSDKIDTSAMCKKTIDYLLLVKTLPEDLARVLHDSEHYLFETAKLYQKLIDTKFLWKIRAIDGYGKIWIDINLIAENGHPEFHELAIDEGTFERIEWREYEISSDR